jgi:pimeloyl-ACP methyl ester carboxylesterase
VPDYRPCDEALTRLANEDPPTGRPVELGRSASPLHVMIVPGVGWTCFEEFLAAAGTAADHIARFGHEMSILTGESLSSSGRNAQIIRDTIMAMPEAGRKRIVLVGYSKGAPDILEAVATYPELQNRVAAVVSAAGAVGGSPLVYDTSQDTLELLQHFPGAKCEEGDRGAIESLKPSVRQQWLARNPLPRSIRFYSIVAFPQPAQISSVLRTSYDKLSQVDPRNDSQVIFYDAVIPGSTVLAYLNADHWAVGVPLARSHPVIASMFVDKNAFPRDALLEAVVRYIEEDLAAPRVARSPSR